MKEHAKCRCTSPYWSTPPSIRYCTRVP